MALTLKEQAASSTPSSGYMTVYAKSDGKLYAKDDAGTEVGLLVDFGSYLPRSVGRNITGQNNAAQPNYRFDWNADEFAVQDSNGVSVRLETVDVTVDITASGANGLDTGSEANSTWYYGHIIYNPTTDTVAGLLSTSWTAPTLPSGYTFSAPIGAVYNTSSGDLRHQRQVGSAVWVLNNVQILADGTATSSAPIDLSTVIPAVALEHWGMWAATGTADGSGNLTMNLVLEIVSGTPWIGLSNALFGLAPSSISNAIVAPSFQVMPNNGQAAHYWAQVGSGSSPSSSYYFQGFRLPIGGQ